MSINYQSLVVGAVEAKEIHAAPVVGGVVLQFGLSWSLEATREHKFTIFNTQAWVNLAAEGEPNSMMLGCALPEGAWCEESHEYHLSDRLLSYRLVLPGAQMLAIEQIRQGRGLMFTLDVRGNAVGPNGIRQIYEKLQLRVNVSDWVRVLKEGGFADVLLVGVHIPTGVGNQRSQAAIELIKRANEQLVLGHYTSAVAECRRAIESLWKSLGLELEAQAARKRLSSSMDERRSMSRRERELAVGESIRNFAHLAHHVGDDAQPEAFGRLDAALAVATTAALASMLISDPDISVARLGSPKPMQAESAKSEPNSSLEARVTKATEHLSKNPKNRPRTRKNLRSLIDSLFQKALSDSELDFVLDELIKRKVATSDTSGKLTYPRA